MAASGRLRIGVNASISNIPRLVTVKVLPLSCSPAIEPLRVLLDQLGRLRRDVVNRLAVGIAQHRRQQSALGIDRDADMRRVVLGDRVAIEPHIQLWLIDQRQR